MAPIIGVAAILYFAIGIASVFHIIIENDKEELTVGHLLILIICLPWTIIVGVVIFVVWLGLHIYEYFSDIKWLNKSLFK